MAKLCPHPRVQENSSPLFRPGSDKSEKAVEWEQSLPWLIQQKSSSGEIQVDQLPEMGPWDFWVDKFGS